VGKRARVPIGPVDVLVRRRVWPPGCAQVCAETPLPVVGPWKILCVLLATSSLIQRILRPGVLNQMMSYDFASNLCGSYHAERVCMRFRRARRSPGGFAVGAGARQVLTNVPYNDRLTLSRMVMSPCTSIHK
jgi:hypothetical protein